MKTKMCALGAMLVCLLLSLPACTRKGVDKPILVAPDEPVIVTKTEYVQVASQLLVPIESALGFRDVYRNGNMYGALTHDSQWLDTCKANMDQITQLYQEAALRKAQEKAAAPLPSQ